MSKIAEVLERLAALEAAVGIGHNGGPPLDDDKRPPKRKAGLLPDREVAQRYGVSVRTVERWSANRALGFPPPVYILRRRYRDIETLDKWDRDCVRRIADPHHELNRRYVPEALSRPRAQRGRFNKSAGLK
jgi:hypothetical protein